MASDRGAGENTVRENAFTVEEARTIATFMGVPMKAVEGIGYLAWLKQNGAK